MKAETFTSRLESKEYLSKDIIKLVFNTKGFSFQAGQFVQVMFKPGNEDSYRDYSMLNPPSAKGIELCMKLIPNGYSSEIFRDAVVGKEFLMKGPLGKFLFNTSGKEHVFMAAGTGIVPIYSMIMENVRNHRNNTFTLLYSVKDIDELVFHKEFLDLEARQDNFHYHPMITNDAISSNPRWNGLKGRFQDNIDDLIDYKNKTFYICGLKDFIKDAVTWLRKKNVDNKSILFERYD